MKTKLLFVCPLNPFASKSVFGNALRSSFIQNDLDILRRHFDVRVAHYQGKKKLLKFLIKTLKGVLWADVTFSWFADVHALNEKIIMHVHTIE
ncbi:MAG: hypothetical protein U9O59_00370 [Actinomycetota bacterium]|nr:hypothetical protein [Actinomycetota bacterium]